MALELNDPKACPPSTPLSSPGTLCVQTARRSVLHVSLLMTDRRSPWLRPHRNQSMDRLVNGAFVRSPSAEFQIVKIYKTAIL